MNCECVATVNEGLATRNLELDTMFVLSKPNIPSLLYISTHWKDENKKQRGKRPTKLAVNFCPFCGVKVD